MNGKILVATEPADVVAATYFAEQPPQIAREKSLYLISVNLNRYRNYKSFVVVFNPTDRLLIEKHYHHPGEKQFFVLGEEHHYLYDKDKHLLFYASQTGVSLMREQGYCWFMEEILNPANWENTVIGDGSESIVYKTLMFGRPMVIKLVNYQAIEDLNQVYRIFSREASVPDFLCKFGKTEIVEGALRLINQYKPFLTFKLVPSPKDLVAGRDFILQEYVDHPTLKSHSQYENAEWVSLFDEELKYVIDLFTACGIWMEDFAPTNWLVVSPDAHCPELCLIDQDPAGIVDARNMLWEDREYAAADALKRHADTDVFHALNSYFVEALSIKK